MNWKEIKWDMRYFGTPLELQVDSGFGNMADDYFGSACLLAERDEYDHLENPPTPNPFFPALSAFAKAHRMPRKQRFLHVLGRGLVKFCGPPRVARIVATNSTGEVLHLNDLPERLRTQTRNPAAFLCRHAVELYLKSLILILHRYHKIPFDLDPPSTSEPKVKVAGQWKPLFKEHGVQNLHDYFVDVYGRHINTMAAEVQADWSLNKAFASWIRTIDGIDLRSDYFRYPASKNAARDAEKGGTKEVSLDWAKQFGGGLAFTMRDGRIWTHGLDILKEEMNHLYYASSELFILHNLLRQQLYNSK